MGDTELFFSNLLFSFSSGRSRVVRLRTLFPDSFFRNGSCRDGFSNSLLLELSNIFNRAWTGFGSGWAVTNSSRISGGRTFLLRNLAAPYLGSSDLDSGLSSGLDSGLDSGLGSNLLTRLETLAGGEIVAIWGPMEYWN